ncbi:hypothetical protein FA048_04210 [Pedobacter polaris]|uniref:Lipoprotein n=1 Tax=Pedobacter polaris TaxID=2571273 RepID=A0A4U1CUB9_9SPHI|nr:hypothetical protein [Pedobacter polaris]TKC12827.1 hypothetical protein FA048_04210 [Pedobacter polaris]
MMKNNFLSLAVLATLLASTSCSTPKKVAGNYYNHKTECLSVELDGTQIVNAWSNTAESITVIEQAKRNAINDVLFVGLLEGKNNCNVQPILAAANIKSNNEAYFNKFFAAGGPYINYVSVKDDKVEMAFWNEKDPEIIKKIINKGFILRLNRPALKEKMIADGILK